MITPTLALRYLKAAVSSVPNLAAVETRETERMINGGQPFDWEGYLLAVTTAAQLYDTHHPKAEVNLTSLDPGTVTDTTVRLSEAFEAQPPNRGAQLPDGGPTMSDSWIRWLGPMRV